jgi:anthranilate phosphoribosyltransferase
VIVEESSMKQCIQHLFEGKDLSLEQSRAAMMQIMSGQATDAQIAAFLTALRMKGETVQEITGCALAMRKVATCIDAGGADAIDTCGTGGDTSGTFNVSTAAGIVAAAAGVPVAKHGNRSVSSSSGSADVLQQLGVNIEAPKEVVEKCLRDVGIGFLFAPMLHKAMKYAIGPRRELGVRTVFNMLGPLTNPAGVRRQVMGVYGGDIVEKIAGVLRELGSKRAMVIHSQDGLDELSVCDVTNVAELKDGEIEVKKIAPEDVGLVRHSLAKLRVRGVDESAAIIMGVLNGEEGAGRDMVSINAGAAIYVGGKADTLRDGVELACEAIDTGRARATLEKLVEVSNM